MFSVSLASFSERVVNRSFTSRRLVNLPLLVSRLLSLFFHSHPAQQDPAAPLALLLRVFGLAGPGIGALAQLVRGAALVEALAQCLPGLVVGGAGARQAQGQVLGGLAFDRADQDGLAAWFERIVTGPEPEHQALIAGWPPEQQDFALAAVQLG